MNASFRTWITSGFTQWLLVGFHIDHHSELFLLCFRELIRCLKWYMDRSAEVVRQDHIQEAMRVRAAASRPGADR